jgi:hypothetical protein
MVDLTNLNLNANGKIISGVDEYFCDHDFKKPVMHKDVACLSVFMSSSFCFLYNLAVLSAKILECSAVLLVANYSISLTS